MTEALLGMGGGMNAVEKRSPEWYTPPHVFDALGLDFDLDPCAPEGGVPWIPALRSCSLADDGLSQPWEGRVWLNPPYGNAAPRWVGRLIEHGDGIALVFARTDPAWGQYALRCADAVCFIAGRLRFRSGLERNGPGHNAPASSMLLAYGRECADAVTHCGLGVVLQPKGGLEQGHVEADERVAPASDGASLIEPAPKEPAP